MSKKKLKTVRRRIPVPRPGHSWSFKDRRRDRKNFAGHVKTGCASWLQEE